MYRPLMANDQPGHVPSSPTRSISKTKKASTACLACKQRKTKCSGGRPCDQCGQRGSQCVYDLASDQRRKIANQRNIQELAQKAEDIERFCVLLGGILATIRAGNEETVQDLVHTVRQRTGLPELAIYVDSLMTTWPEVYDEFSKLDFYLDDSPRQPSAEDAAIKHEYPNTKTSESRVPDNAAGYGGLGPAGAQSLSNETSMSSAEESERRPFIADGPTSGPDHVMVDGDATPSDVARRHMNIRSGSDGSTSAQSFRPPRPWELD